MHRFRHKTKKEEFLLPYYAAAAANMGGMLMLVGISPHERARLLSKASRLLNSEAKR